MSEKAFWKAVCGPMIRLEGFSGSGLRYLEEIERRFDRETADEMATTYASESLRKEWLDRNSSESLGGVAKEPK